MRQSEETNEIYAGWP